MRLTIFLLCFQLLFGPLASAATYYVRTDGSNSNSGLVDSAGGAWRTITKAAQTMVAGDTTIVGDGTYIEAAVSFATQGSSGAPIKLRAANQHLAILSSTSQCNPSIGIDAAYITIENMRIKRDASDVACGGALGSPSSARAMLRAWGNAGSTGIQHHAIMRGLYIDPGADVGIKTNGDYDLVENSTIHNGLEGMNGIDVIFRNNLVDGYDYWESMVTSKGGMRNFLFYNNIVHRPTAHGLTRAGTVLGGSTGCVGCMSVPGDAYECLNCVAWNNIFRDDTTQQFPQVSLASCKDCTVMNNVFIGSGHFQQTTGGSVSIGSAHNPRWLNNLVNCGGGEAYDGTFLVTGTQTTDYNNFFNCTGVPSQTHAISGNPLFVNSPSDLHLQAGSPAINAGTTVTVNSYPGTGTSIDVSRDYADAVRSAPWEAGIYEFGSSPSSSPRFAPGFNLRRTSWEPSEPLFSPALDY